MNKDKINCLQFGSMMSMLLMASFVGIGMFSIIKSAGVDAYLSIIIAALVGILILLTFFIIFDYEPSLSVKDKINKIFGIPFGFILNLLLILVVFTMGISAMFNLTNFITSQFLKETPPWVIGFCFSILIVIVNIKGIETLSRTCLILYCICLFLFVMTLIGLIPQFEFSNLKPFLEYGLKKPLVGAGYNLLFNLLPIYLFLIIPKDKLVDKGKYRKYLWIFYAISVIVKFLLVVITIGVLGINLASIYQYPEYIVLKRINMFNFLDRIENFITIQWLFGLFFNLSFVVYYISNTLKTDNKSKILPFFITGIILIGSVILFKNNTIFNDYTYTKVPYIRLVLLFIYTLLFIGIIIKKIFTKKIN